MRRFGCTLALLLVPAVLAACGPGGSKSGPSPTVTASVAPVVVATVAPAPTPSPTPATAAGAVYAVKPGDTLSGIASQNKTSVDAIVKANNLADPDKLQVGQQLTIPSAAAGASAAPAASGPAGALPPAASKPPPP